MRVRVCMRNSRLGSRPPASTGSERRRTRSVWAYGSLAGQGAVAAIHTTAMVEGSSTEALLPDPSTTCGRAASTAAATVGRDPPKIRMLEGQSVARGRRWLGRSLRMTRRLRGALTRSGRPTTSRCAVALRVSLLAHSVSPAACHLATSQSVCPESLLTSRITI